MNSRRDVSAAARGPPSVKPRAQARPHRHEGNLMTVTAIPVTSAGATGARVLRGSRSAPYTTASGHRVLPGCYGISHGGSITGDLIRPATRARAGHAFIYIRHRPVVGAGPPPVRISPAAAHPDAIWNVRCPLTAAQRDRICARALALVGRAYDYPAYTGFALRVLKVRDGAELDPVFKADHWRVCSGVGGDCSACGGTPLQRGLGAPTRPGPAGRDPGPGPRARPGEPEAPVRALAS